MSPRLYQCPWCAEIHRTATEAALCCNPAAFNPDDPDDNPDIERSADQC